MSILDHVSCQPPARIWRRRPFDPKRAATLASELEVPFGIGAILLQRGLDDPRAAHDFLNPAFEQLPSPFLMKGMAEATAILADAIRQGRAVAVYGDYDVDGATGTAVLALFLRRLGLTVHARQPHRLHHGYGLHRRLIPELQALAPGGVLITVDCGISDREAVAAANEGGLTVIVTDHHQPPSTLPPADAVLNPLQPGCSFPFKHLAGVGVAFYLAMGLRSRLKEQGYWPGAAGMPNLRELLDLAAVGTVADIVPLVGPNRIFVRAGLEVLQEARRPGLACLLETAGLLGKRLTAEDIGFRLGPRINAAGRLGDPGRALDLLLTDDSVLARKLAHELEKANRDRHALEEGMACQAMAAAAEFIQAGRRTMVLLGDAWHPGVLGIVASRVLNRFYRTTILLTEKEGLLSGSGRSVPEFHLHHALEGCKDLLVRYGGHANAAGLALQPESLPAFRERFEAEAAQLAPEDLRPKLLVDGQATDDLFGGRFQEAYLRLAPFGMGNPEPVFASAGCRLLKPRLVGEKHLKFLWPHNGGRLEGIGFGFGHLLPILKSQEVGLAFSLRLNEFRGRESWQVNLVDIDLDPKY
ncbi:MAG: single-stranded-DNA-specific exonuclease RecJ [Desulfobacteraceae bacterium]|nr:single-stranded-DNA-specific exonuclease RecJ [Desulfobacteraceae bacterium]